MSTLTDLRSKLARVIAPSAVSGRRSFDAATGGRRGFGVGTSGSINPEVGASAERIRQRARYLYQNNPWIANAVNNWVSQAVGSGIQANSAHPDPATREALDKEFARWSSEADADGRTNWVGLQSEVFRSMVVDGEAILQKIITSSGVRLRQIPAEQLDSTKTIDLDSGGMIVQGVEFDATGQRIAYWVHPSKPTAMYANYAPSVRIDADQIIHIFKPLAPGQVRGVSWLASVILQAGEFDQLTDALLVGTKVAAMHAAFVVDPNATGSVAYDFDDAHGLANASLEPGVLRILPVGTDIRFSSPQQSKDVSAFLKLNLQALAAGLGLPTFLLSNDLSDSNYSSLRAGLLPLRARCEAIQKQVLTPQFLHPVWRAVTEVNVMSGLIEAPDFETNRAEYDAVGFLPPRPMQVDPAKEIQAVKESLEIGLTSRRRAVASTGCNVEDLDAEIATDREREAGLGLSFTNSEESSNA